MSKYMKVHTESRCDLLMSCNGYCSTVLYPPQFLTQNGLCVISPILFWNRPRVTTKGRDGSSIPTGKEICIQAFPEKLPSGKRLQNYGKIHHATSGKTHELNICK